MKTNPLVVERIFDAPLSKVWIALTDKDEMKKWYFDLKEFKPEVGFKFQFTGCSKNDIQYLHNCEIKEVIFEKKLIYSWSYDGYEGESFVIFELAELDGKTHLKLTHLGLETFSQDNPDFYKENFAEGWNELINSSLKNYTDNLKN